MIQATEDLDELKRCRRAFERDEDTYHMSDITKRRGNYVDPDVGVRWQTWRRCWDYIKS